MTQTPLSEAVQHLQRGAVVAFPTETVYGMGADAENPDAVRDIFRLKQRPANIPLTIHLGTRCDPSRYAHIDERAQALMDAFWPGPLTLILPKQRTFQISLRERTHSGLRMPSHHYVSSFSTHSGEVLLRPPPIVIKTSHPPQPNTSMKNSAMNLRPSWMAGHVRSVLNRQCCRLLTIPPQLFDSAHFLWHALKHALASP